MLSNEENIFDITLNRTLEIPDAKFLTVLSDDIFLYYFVFAHMTQWHNFVYIMRLFGSEKMAFTFNKA